MTLEYKFDPKIVLTDPNPLASLTARQCLTPMAISVRVNPLALRSPHAITPGVTTLGSLDLGLGLRAVGTLWRLRRQIGS